MIFVSQCTPDCEPASNADGTPRLNRHKEWKELFTGSAAGLVFVTAFSSRDTKRNFLPLISWETEVWVVAAPDHLIHFNGERFSGPYPDVMPSRPTCG